MALVCHQAWSGLAKPGHPKLAVHGFHVHHVHAYQRLGRLCSAVSESFNPNSNMGRGVGGASSVWTTAWHGLKRHGKVEFCSHCLRWVRWLFLNLFWVLPSRPVAGCFFRVLPSLSVAGCDLFVIFTSGSYRPGWPCHLLGRSLQCFMSPTDKSLEPGMV